jgi:hypothetical protein
MWRLSALANFELYATPITCVWPRAWEFISSMGCSSDKKLHKVEGQLALSGEAFLLKSFT